MEIPNHHASRFVYDQQKYCAIFGIQFHIFKKPANNERGKLVLIIHTVVYLHHLLLSYMEVFLPVLCLRMKKLIQASNEATIKLSKPSAFFRRISYSESLRPSSGKLGLGIILVPYNVGPFMRAKIFGSGAVLCHHRTFFPQLKLTYKTLFQGTLFPCAFYILVKTLLK